MSTQRPVRVLLVDDVADLRRVLRGVLEGDGGFAVVGEAGDGVEAVELAAELQPDVVLLDIDLPRRSGLEVLPVIRTVAPPAKIVVLSGLPPEAMAEPCRSAGAVGFLAKGIKAKQLINELREITGLLDVVEQAMAERRVVVEDEVTSPRVARRFVGEALAEWELDGVRDAVEVLVSELVTNAVIHARSKADVAVILHRDVVRIEVTDESSDMPRARKPAPDAPSGRGLALVAQIASDWGVQANGRGKVVWFEVPRRVGAEEVVIE